MKKLKIHWFELHYNGVSAGDHFTNVPGLVTCSYCKRLIAKRRRTLGAVDGARRPHSVSPAPPTHAPNVVAPPPPPHH